MTPSTIFVLYIVGVVVTFLILPIMGVKKGDNLLIASLFFPLVWIAMTFLFVMQFAQMYIDFLEKRNEKDS